MTPPLRQLPPGTRTDLAVLALQGGLVDDRGDHLVVRAPHNPDFHFGNYVVVTTGDPDDVAHWLDVFHAQFPQARYVALGLPRAPAAASFADLDLELDVDEALELDGLPHLLPLAAGYTARELATDEDWEQVRRAEAVDNERTGRFDPDAHDRFVRAQIRGRRELVAQGHAAFFGAFHGHHLVSNLGIVVLGDDARYQSVSTVEEHRRRGLAGHLLGRAAQWAADRGARHLVIVTGTTNPAGRLYRSVGFGPTDGGVNLYRAPAR